MVKTVLLTPAEVGARLGVTTQTLAIWRSTRQHLKFVKIGRLVRYPEQEIERFVESQTQVMASNSFPEGHAR